MKLSAADKRTWAMGCAGLLEPEEYMHLGRRPRPKRTRKPSLVSAIKAARKAGIAKGTVTVGDVSVTFGDSETQQGTELDEWMKKHAH
jgi:hypothetical protein